MCGAPSSAGRASTPPACAGPGTPGRFGRSAPRRAFKSRSLPGAAACAGCTEVGSLAPGPDEPPPRPYPAHNKGGSLLDARRSPQGPAGGPARRRHLAVPRATPVGRTGGAGRRQRGRAGRPGRRRDAGRGAGRDSPSQRPGCAPRGAGGRRAAAARGRAGAPWRRARGGGDRRGRRGAAAGRSGGRGGRLTPQGRGAKAAHRPGRGGSRRRPERGPASSPICWRCPLPSAARGRRLKGEDPAARVRGGGSARPADCAAARRDARARRSAPSAAAARPCPRARPAGRRPSAAREPPGVRPRGR